MTYRVVTQPAVEPLTLQDAKDWLREDGTEQDLRISALISAARRYAENYTRRAYVYRESELTLPSFPARTNEIELPFPPLVTVRWVKYIDIGGVLQTVDPTLYQVDSNQAPGRIKPAYLAFWRPTRNDYSAVQVRYFNGYAPDDSGSPTDFTSMLPTELKQWMLLRIATLYENREAVNVGNLVTPFPRDSVDGLLDGLIVNLMPPADPCQPANY